NGDLIRAATTPSTVRSGASTRYGFGLSISAYRGMPYVHHGGTTSGYRANVAILPDRGVAIAILCNAFDASPETMTKRVADVIVGQATPRAETKSATGRSSNRARDFAGLYRRAAADEAYELTADSSGLALQPFGFHLEPTSDSTFEIGFALLSFTFSKPE